MTIYPEECDDLIDEIHALRRKIGQLISKRDSARAHLVARKIHLKLDKLEKLGIEDRADKPIKAARAKVRQIERTIDPEKMHMLCGQLDKTTAIIRSRCRIKL